MMNAETLELMTNLIKTGDFAAMEKVADYFFYETNKQKLSADQFNEIFEMYMKLAEQGNGHAMAVIGVMYYEGVNIKQDYRLAKEWYEKAAEAGDTWGINNLGYCYYYGREIECDYEKAYYYFGRSAARGNHCGMYKIGDMYYYGKYIEQNYK
ncbi:MAG: tetratricopeptide repeat protein, partial [Eubacterium sp.]